MTLKKVSEKVQPVFFFFFPSVHSFQDKKTLLASEPDMDMWDAVTSHHLHCQSPGLHPHLSVCTTAVSRSPALLAEPLEMVLKTVAVQSQILLLLCPKLVHSHFSTTRSHIPWVTSQALTGLTSLTSSSTTLLASAPLVTGFLLYSLGWRPSDSGCVNWCFGWPVLLSPIDAHMFNTTAGSMSVHMQLSQWDLP